MSDCLLCYNHDMPLNGRCTSCAPGQYYDQSVSLCLACGTGCQACGAAGNCTNCSAGVLTSGVCLTCESIYGPYISQFLDPVGCKELCGTGHNHLGTKQCDDGNVVSGDGCSSSCEIEAGYECTQGRENISECRGINDRTFTPSLTLSDAEVNRIDIEIVQACVYASSVPDPPSRAIGNTRVVGNVKEIATCACRTICSRGGTDRALCCA